LVILLGSPKSVARALQRVGRSGHQLHSVTKGRFIVMDRDDLVECSVLLKSAVEKRIDAIHIPTNALDVLAQEVYGICLEESQSIKDIYDTVKKSYCFKDLKHEDFMQIIDYLSGKFSSLEDRYIFAKIWHDEATGMVGKRGKLARVMYMTNIGTIPEEAMIHVKMGELHLGTIDEGFLERMQKGDVFVLRPALWRRSLLLLEGNLLYLPGILRCCHCLLIFP
jgi:ATP-dependent Lhr-like helicase